MKLSELFKTPFKVKGGGVLNLKGFSKRVVDKEIEGGSGDAEDIEKFIKTLFTFYAPGVMPEIFSMFGVDSDAGYILLKDVDSLGTFYFLYPEGTTIDRWDNVIYAFTIQNGQITINVALASDLAAHTVTINDINYIHFLKGAS